MSLSLSAAAEPAHAAAWLEGFLNRNAVVLLHDATVWSLVDDWLAGLGEEHFLRVLPLVRRTFSAFAATELRDLSLKARSKPGATSAAAATAGGDDVLAAWDAERAALPLPLLRTLLGMPAATATNGEPA